MRKKKCTQAVLLAASAALLFSINTASVYATEIDMDNISEVKISEDGNWIREGGMNRYDGTLIESKEQGLETEKRLKIDNYIEINELSAKQYEAFIMSADTDWWFENYIISPDDKHHGYYKDWFKIYVYEPSFMDWWESYQAVGEKAYNVDSVPRLEIENSSVVIDYRAFWSLERVGADLSHEMNDGIPEWYDTGYICITSPIDAEIKFYMKDESNYYTVYVRGGIPFRAEMKSGNYSIVEINGTEITQTNKYMTNANNINIGWEDNPSLEEPMEVDTSKAVEAYNIRPIDLTGKPDRSIDQNQQLASEEQVVIDDDTPEKTEDVIQTDEPNWFKRILIGIIVAALCVAIGAYLYLDRRRRR